MGTLLSKLTKLLQAMKTAKTRPVLTVWYDAMPESNGKSNFTAILHRKGECLSKGVTIDRSEYPDRVRYEADRVRFLIGEIDKEPYILDYDDKLRSDYSPPTKVPNDSLDLVIGWIDDEGLPHLIPAHDDYTCIPANSKLLYKDSPEHQVDAFTFHRMDEIIKLASPLVELLRTEKTMLEDEDLNTKTLKKCNKVSDLIDAYRVSMGIL